MSLPARAEAIIDETAVEFSYAVVLFEGYATPAPTREDAATYAESLDDPSYPVLSSEDVAVIDATPYTGRPLPGKCLLSPRMQLLGCDSGHGEDDWAVPLILANENR